MLFSCKHESFTVVDRDRQSEVVNKDMSFNGNIDVDFSSNYKFLEKINACVLYSILTTTIKKYRITIILLVLNY